jgi:aminopeptidase N
MEHESGQDLAWFFKQWLNARRAGDRRHVAEYDQAAKQVVVTVTQTQAGEPFRFPLGVGISQTAGGPPRVQRLDVTRRDDVYAAGRIRTRIGRPGSASGCWRTSARSRKA